MFYSHLFLNRKEKFIPQIFFQKMITSTPPEKHNDTLDERISKFFLKKKKSQYIEKRLEKKFSQFFLFV